MDTMNHHISMIDAAEKNDESFYIRCIYPNAEPEKKGDYVQNAVKPQGK